MKKLADDLNRKNIFGSTKQSSDPHLNLLLHTDEERLISDELFRISLAYQYGTDGLTQDDNRAISYCRKAAERGHCVAQLFLAQWLMSCPDDASPEVLYWLQKAAEQGEPQACYNLGISVHRGDIKGKDRIKDSLPLFRHAAERAYTPAYTRMAIIYANGEGVERNRNIAKYWSYLDFANASNEEARLKSIFYTLLEPTDVIGGNQVSSHKIIMEAAHEGERDALTNWGTGMLPEDKDKAFDLLNKAWELGHPLAACNLARQLWIPAVKKYDQALFLYRTAAETGEPAAQYGLAVMYGGGLGVVADMHQCWHWLEKSLNIGYDEARVFFSHLIHNNQLIQILPDKLDRDEAYLALANMASD